MEKILCNSEPTLDEWRLLYEASVKFRDTHCWEWMNEEEIIAVQDPIDGVIYYCIIMGSAGIHCALAAYKGESGLASLLNILEETEEEDLLLNVGMEQACLQCAFEDRAQLATEDLQRIKSLNLKFRGRGQWPVFRDYQPGKYPWVLTGQQCRALRMILEQVLPVVIQAQEEDGILWPSQQQVPLISYSAAEGKWKQESHCLRLPELATLAPVPINEILLSKWKKQKAVKGSAWEIGYFRLPSPVAEKKERPYFPHSCMVIDVRTRMILTAEIVEDFATGREQFLDRIIDCLEQSSHKPDIIYVSQVLVCELLEEFCHRTGIKLQRVEQLIAMIEVKEEMTGMFRQR